MGAERVVDGEGGEEEWKGKLAIPGLWDEGFIRVRRERRDGWDTAGTPV